MGFKKSIQGMDEDQIKKFVKISIFSGKKLHKTKSFKKSKYLKEIIKEAAQDLKETIKGFEEIECPEERWKMIEKSLSK